MGPRKGLEIDREGVPSRQLQRTAEMGGFRPFVDTGADAKVAPIAAVLLTSATKGDPLIAVTRRRYADRLIDIDNLSGPCAMTV